MTPERQAEFDAAAVPFHSSGGAISVEHTKLAPWRVFLEINAMCNLKCPSCTKGNMENYDHEKGLGLMDWDLMGRILDKIAIENPDAIVFLYGNSEPFLHPKLAECIAEVHKRGLHPELSTNLNYINRVPEVLAAKPDFMIISLSGWTQDVYVKGHANGNIEKVKANMRILAETNNRIPEQDRVKISVNYHCYNDNEHEIPLMREYCQNLGLGFFTSFARAISMENAIQYLRSQDIFSMPYEKQEGKPDYNAMLPPISQSYIDTMKRLKIPPEHARDMYASFPEVKACPIGQMFCFIRHDGLTEMCACVADRRLTLGNYLEMSQDDLSEKRYNHPICQQCQRYKMSHYFHINRKELWE